MKWIKINSRHELPRDGSIFLAIWKGRVALVEHDTEDDRYYIQFEPAWTGSWQIDQEREDKFTYWMKLPEKPEVC